MSVEKITAQVVVEVDKSSLSQSQQEMDRLKSPISVKMAIDLGALRQQLGVLKGALAEALKVGDVQLAKKLGGDIEIMKKQITGLNRELTNFVRTGDKEVSMLGKMFNQVGVDINSGFGKVLGAISGSFAQGASSALDKVGLGATKLGQSMQKLGADANASGMTIGKAFGSGIILAGVAAVGTALYAVGKQAIFLADKLEQTSISFEVMLGSGEKAKQMLADLNNLAAKSPTLEILGIRDTAKQLLAFGLDSESIVQTIKMLGDVSAATGVELSRIGYAYGQVRTAGKLYGTELRQFTEAGVPLLGELAKMYGVTESAAREMVTDGKVGFNDVQQAFVNLTSEGGKMANMMGRQAETLSGKWAKLKDDVTIFLEQMGSALLPTAKLIVDGTSWMFQQFKNSFTGMQIITTIFTAYFIDSMYAAQDAIKGMGAFFRKFGAAWTGIWSGAGDTVATWVINVGIAIDNLPYYIQTGLNKALQLFSAFSNKIGDLQNRLAESLGLDPVAAKVDLSVDFGATKKQFESYNTAILNGTFEQIDAINIERKNFSDAIKEKRDINKVALKDYLTEVTTQKTASKDINSTLKKMAEDQNSDKEKKGKKGTDIAKKAEEERKKIQKESIEFQKKVFENASKLREADLKNTEEYIGKLKDALKEITDIEKEIAGVGEDAAGKTLDAAGDRYRNLLEQQKESQKDLEIATREYGAGLVAPEQKILDSVTSQIKELENSGILDQNTKAKEQQRASLSKPEQDRFDFQDQLGQIAIEKANKEAELQRKKLEIEQKLGLSKFQAEQELIIQEKRKSANEQALTKYKDIIALIEGGITDNTQKEIDRRMALYAQEEQRLLRLIELRMQAGYAVGAIAPAPVSNTNNNTVNQTVNANVANSVDMKQLANTLARSVTLANKGISK